MTKRFSGRLETLAGAAVLISVVTLASRLLGFGRSIAQATWVGTGGVAEHYAVANQLPNILFEVVAGGALAGAVIPLLAGALSKECTQDVSRTASALLTWTLVALVPLAAFVAIFAPQIINLTSNLGQTQYAGTATMFLVIFAVQIPLYGLGVVFGGILQAHRKFLWPALAPMFSSIVVITTYFVFGKLANGNQTSIDQLTATSLGILAWGTTAGVLAMALTMIGPVKKLGLKFQVTLGFPPGVGRRARNLALAGVGALIAQQLTMLVVMKVATTYGSSQTFNLFQYSQAVYVLPYAVLVVPLATSTFPRISALAAQSNQAAFDVLAAGTTRALVVISAAGAAALIAAAKPLEQFFETFTLGGAHGMAQAIAWSAPGLIGFSLIFHLSRILYARDNGRAAVTGAATGWLTAAALTAILPTLNQFQGHPELTLAIIGGSQSVGMTVAGIILIIAVAVDSGRAAIAGMVKTLLISLVGLGAGSLGGVYLGKLLQPAGTTPNVFGAVGTGLVVGLAAAVTVCVVNIVSDPSMIKNLRTMGGAPATSREAEQ